MSDFVLKPNKIRRNNNNNKKQKKKENEKNKSKQKNRQQNNNKNLIKKCEIELPRKFVPRKYSYIKLALAI